MNDSESKIDLEAFSRLATEKTGKNIKFIKSEKVGGGYHSDGFKLITDNNEKYFVKYIRSYDLGLEYPERHISSMLVSNGMGQRTNKDPKPIGVIVTNDKTETILPDIDQSTKVYHLQEFGGTGKSYYEILLENSNKKEIDEDDKKQLYTIADELIKIHSIKHSSSDPAKLKAIYNDSLRNVLIHPELSIMALTRFPVDYEVLDLEGQKEIINLMYENIREIMDQPERLSALHGDFWGSNIFFKEDGNIFIIDFSRIPWGEPGIDVSWFISPMLWQYHLTGNDYFRQLAELWLDIYEQKSGDKEIRKMIPLVIGWAGIVQIFPDWFVDIDISIGNKFISHVMEILRRKELFWPDKS